MNGIRGTKTLARSTQALTVVMALGLITLVLAPSFAGPSGTFICSAQTVRIEGTTVDDSLPIANAGGTGCPDEEVQQTNQTVQQGGFIAHFELLTAATGSALTTEQAGCSDIDATTAQANACAGIANVMVALPGDAANPNDDVGIEARVLRSEGSVECKANSQGKQTAQPPTFSGEVLELTVCRGLSCTTVEPIGHQHVSTPLGTVHVLHEETKSTERGTKKPEIVTQSAVFFEPSAGSPVPEFALAEATAGFTGPQPCAPGQTKPTSSP